MKNFITIKQNIEQETVINKSRFITYLFKVENEDEAKAKIDEIKALHKDATHNCSAYTVGDSHQIQKANDDGEPSGTAGVPMLESLKKNDIHNVVAIVTRYFGGIKLGSGGLIRAYQGRVSEAIQLAGKVIYKNGMIIQVTLPYELSGKFEHAIDDKFIIINQTYTDKVIYDVQLVSEDKDEFINFVTELTQGLPVIQVKSELMLPFDIKNNI
ncbi:YigZ family protein [Macrococcoides caseolyticum]|uniref:YigZ family protein n=1 Tax=Macrococcoides caseolyticum TaxID=69966 RepID=UPI000A2950F9|nr:YigZ family protein [Macrococcus caseolyticus]ARQ03854.1 IMPACT family member YigZ [Macrococcus caseolyticus]PKE05882.1 YigZ family protein [Macrococcus caseolyticus]PKE12864.1 YigZ family protein [Macrococcus caseolyticus]PKE23054.1 YigZ family protein [Macrococcus caseolyticus]PKE36096.1 YigZ family protein [Macrococcus caseolyticus]